MSARSLSACGEQSDGMGQRDRQTSVMSALSGVQLRLNCPAKKRFRKTLSFSRM